MLSPHEKTVYDGFRGELENLINSHSMENGANVPDFVLAQYLIRCLLAFDEAVVARDKFFGGEKVQPPLKGAS